MKKFSALPGRPLTTEEADYLDQSGRFEAVVPVGIVSFKEPPVQLLCGVIIVSSTRLIGLAYDVDQGAWNVVYETDHEGLDAPSDGTEFSEATHAVEDAITDGGPDEAFTDDDVNAGLTAVSSEHQEALLSQYRATRE